MNNRKILETGTVVVALVLSVIAVTVAFAANNSNLKINGSGTAKGTRWSISFTDLQNAVTGNDKGVTSTAREATKPTITGETAIGTYKVELATPGDYISYDFTINNTGDFNAKIDTSFRMPTPNCTKGEVGKDTDAANVCNNLVYTLKYVDDEGNETTDVQVGDTLASKTTKKVRLKLYYKNTVTQEQLPFDDVKIDNLNIAIPYIQCES